MTRRLDEPDTVEFQTSEGDAVQVMGPRAPYFAFFGQHTAGRVPLFEVDDLDQAHGRLEAADVGIVGTVDRDSHWEWLASEVRTETSTSWAHASLRGDPASLRPYWGT